MHGRNDGETEKKAQVTEQVTIEQKDTIESKTEEIKQRIALFKLRYKEELEKHEQSISNDIRKQDNPLI